MTKKNDTENYLLWLLATDYPSAAALCRDTESALLALGPEGSLNCFGPKLREGYGWTVLSGHLMHLELAARYKRNGFRVRLEPRVGSGTCDFSIQEKGLEGRQVFFEVKNLRDTELASQQRFVDALWASLSRTPFWLSLRIAFEGESPPFLDDVNRFMREKLEGLEANAVSLPVTFQYADSKANLVELMVISRAEGRGGILVVNHDVRSSVSSESIRRKLRKASRQIPRNSPGVVVANGTGLEIDEFSLVQALYGDIVIQFRVDHEAHTTEPLGERRKTNGLFYTNHRISAVCFTGFRLDDEKVSTIVKVFHNPFARIHLDQRVFSDLNGDQYDVVDRNRDGFQMGWIRNDA
ncbi:MAG TPA: hypothetical protein VGR56_02630 [Nitrososphaerales archaeon]|nr:hypothetical protein [Nitrososphaerales archaeon]